MYNYKEYGRRYENYCNNCCAIGHSLSECKTPITSIGVIAFKYINKVDIKYLMVRRRHTFGFMEFMKCKFIYNKQYLLNNNNPYYKQFIDNYNNKDKFKLISIVGIIEKNSLLNSNININNSSQNTQNNDQVTIIDNIINQLQNNISLLQTLKNNICNTNDNNNNNLSDIDLSMLIENTIKNKSLSN